MRKIFATDNVKDFFELADGKTRAKINSVLLYLTNDQIDFYECKLNTHQAVVLKKHYLDGTLTDAVIKQVLMEEDKSTAISLNYNKLKKYFPKHFTVKQCEKALWDILNDWYNKNIA